MNTTSHLRTTAATGLVLIIAMAMVVQPATAASLTLLKVDTGHQMSSLDEPDRFDIVDNANYYWAKMVKSATNGKTDLDVCFYSSTGWQISCHTSTGDEAGYIPGGAAYMEVFLYRGLDVDYEVRQYEYVK